MAVEEGGGGGGGGRWRWRGEVAVAEGGGCGGKEVAVEEVELAVKRWRRGAEVAVEG